MPQPINETLLLAVTFSWFTAFASKETNNK